MTLNPTKKRRIEILDETRGFFYLLMALYHLLYDLVFIFRVDIPLFVSVGMELQPLIPLGFCILTGLSCTLSNRNIKRGAIILAGGVAVTISTLIFMPTLPVWFGVLSMLGTNVIIIGLLGGLLKKIKAALGIIVSTGLFLLLYFAIYLSPRPQFITHSFLFDSCVFMLVGYPAPGFASSDYFPLVPWLFAVLFGYFLGRIILHKMPEWTYKKHIPPLGFIGRHGLIFYLLHQPVIYGVLYLILA